MGYKQTAYARAEALGATIDDDGCTIMVDAPTGKVFSAIELHAMPYDVTWGYTEPGGTKPVWWYIIDDLKYGIEDCTNIHCEYCNS